MFSQHAKFLSTLLALTALLLLSGCMQPYPNYYGQPYGQPMYQGQPVGPGQGVPNGTFAPNGGLYVPNGAPVLGPAPSGTYVPNGPIPSGGPPPINNGNSAPSWRPDPNSSNSNRTWDPNSSGDDKSRLVPDPRDPEFDVNPGATRKQFPGTSQLDDPTFGSMASLPTESAMTDAAMVSRSAPRNLASQYGYDQKEYRWLQGMLDYDEATRTWYVTYNMKPGNEDELGGDVGLITNDSLLRMAQSGEIATGMVVRVVGSVDPTAHDSRGKPMYRVQQVQPVQ